MTKEDLIGAFQNRLKVPRSVGEMLAEEFCKAIADRLGKARTALAAGDFQTLSREAHTIKGCAANAGCESMRLTALRIQLDPGVASMADLDVIEQEFNQMNNKE